MTLLTSQKYIRIVSRMMWLSVLVEPSYRVINGETTLGTFIAFMAYQMRLMSPIQGLMGLYSNLATARASLVRVHDQCVTGDVFGSLRCDCGEQLAAAMAAATAGGKSSACNA